MVATARYGRRMLRSLFVLALVTVSFTACKKEAAKQANPAPATVTTGTVGSDGVRRIAIEASKAGYTPDRVPGKPGEKLTLVFTRTFEADCISQLKTPDGKLVDLPMNKPVEVAVTVPQTGELGFACGMDMFHGVVVAQPSS
ncbi:MAG: Lead, cadmium, zinc and mercury transporting ATPase [Myxococcales bacterium]|nr:Lead, cadmium, zinc and mercury transporting ATPase [Myxococcales bacterium]